MGNLFEIGGDNEKPGMLDSLMAKASKMAAAQLPSCDLCHGTLAGGSITYNDVQEGPKIVCLKCVNTALNYWIAQKRKRLQGKEEHA